MRLIPVLLAMIALALSAGSAWAAKRVALVIGNGDYVHQSPLANPVNDTKAMIETLESIGYDVTSYMNLDEDGMEEALYTFSEKADQADVALVYYSGHGMEISETNYLIPVDAELKRERDARFEAIDLDSVRAAIEGASKLKVVILDACRDNT
ncbi:MAG: caspase family protein, partial [Pseudomonadota bacterium]